jgi:hypothetical protein
MFCCVHRWKSLQSIASFGWCGSAAVGGILADKCVVCCLLYFEECLGKNSKVENSRRCVFIAMACELLDVLIAYQSAIHP